jgi:GT2 family glycosyltransferase
MGDLSDRIKQAQEQACEVRLAIGIPNNFPYIPSAFFDSFVMMDKPPFVFVRSSATHDLAGLRNQIVEQALKAGCTHLIMMDTDQTFQPDTIQRLLAHRKPVVGCMICRRYPPFDPLLFTGEIGRYTRTEGWTEGDLVEVDATGTGCLLIETDVFRNLPAPWFYFGGTKDDPVGEDIAFCSDVRKAGYKIYVDTGVQAGHLSSMLVTTDTWRLYSHLKDAQDAAKAKHEVNHGVIETVAEPVYAPT